MVSWGLYAYDTRHFKAICFNELTQLTREK